jgi:hypothetical protein
MKAVIHLGHGPAWQGTLACIAALLGMGASLCGAQPIGTAGSGTIGTDEAVFGFIQFVRWPLEEQRSEWRVCRAGQPPLQEPVLGPKAARGKAVTLVPIASRDQVTACEVLDLTGLPLQEAMRYLEAARTRPVLTIGSGEAFCSAGGVACMRAHGAAGGFEINLSAAQQAGLNISAQLLMLGRRRVEPEAPR